jgi:hypothetical protein
MEFFTHYTIVRTALTNQNRLLQKLSRLKLACKMPGITISQVTAVGIVGEVRERSPEREMAVEELLGCAERGQVFYDGTSYQAEVFSELSLQRFCIVASGQKPAAFLWALRSESGDDDVSPSFQE